jgi:hypothetical protein
MAKCCGCFPRLPKLVSTRALNREAKESKKCRSSFGASLATVPLANLLQITFFLPLVPGLHFTQFAARDIPVPRVEALNNFTQRNFFNCASIRESYVEWMISAGNGAMLVNGTEIGLVVEEDTAILDRTESHNRFLVLELHPKGIIGRHGDFGMGVETDELKWGLACSSDDPLDIAVGDANNRVAAAVAATRATKFQIFLPILRYHWRLRLAVNRANQKSAANFLATFANIFYTVRSWMVLPVLNKAPQR